MSYPKDAPTAKHDLLSPRIPPDSTTLMSAFGFDSTAALFEALQSEVRGDLKRLGSVYSYPDAPQPPLARELMVIGLLDGRHAVVRKLLSDDEQRPSWLHACHIAVKRADGRHGAALPEKDQINSRLFASFVKRLAKESCVAVIAKDKMGRFGMVRAPSSLVLDGNSGGTEAEYVAEVFVAKVEQVKTFLTAGLVRSNPTNSTETESLSSGLWQPPSTNANEAREGLWQPPSTEDRTTTLWQPPATADDSTNGNGLWQPPSIDDNGFESAWQPPSSASDNGQPVDETTFAGAKRPREETEAKGYFHRDKGAAAADEFYSNLNRNLDTRPDSRLYHMRAFNGWIKSVQIQELDPKTSVAGVVSKKKASSKASPLRVLDLACGKGGDLGKWTLHPRGLNSYVGIDVARGSLVDAAIRARAMRHKLPPRCTFTCADLGADVPGRRKSQQHKYTQKLLTWSLQNENEHELGPPTFAMVRGGGVALDDKFDVVSIQFAIHYMMQTRKRARRFFQTVSELLEIGGNLIATTIDARVVVEHMMNLGLDLHFDDGNDGEEAVIKVGDGACQIRFEPKIVRQLIKSKTNGVGDNTDMFGLEYTFTLVEGSDHAAGVGDAVNLPEWLTPIPVLEALGQEAGLQMDSVQNFHEFFSARRDPSIHGAIHSTMYNMKVLNRNGSISSDEWNISRLYAALKFTKLRESSMEGVESDDEVEEEVDPEEAAAEIEPAIKAKLIPVAMMKAKKNNAQIWDTLEPDEKTRLTTIELVKLAK